MEPALTKEEWAEIDNLPKPDTQYFWVTGGHYGYLGAAAWLLDVEEYFTWDMVYALADYGHPSQPTEDRDLAREAIARIAALLRPEAVVTTNLSKLARAGSKIRAVEVYEDPWPNPIHAKRDGEAE